MYIYSETDMVSHLYVPKGPRKLNRTGWAKLEKQVCSLELSILYLFIPLTLMTSLIIYTFNDLRILRDSNFPKILGLVTLFILSLRKKYGWANAHPAPRPLVPTYKSDSIIGLALRNITSSFPCGFYWVNS